MDSDIRAALESAVRQVNTADGQICVLLRFATPGPDPQFDEVEFLASEATLDQDRFSFTSGFESIDGELGELAGISTAVIQP